MSDPLFRALCRRAKLPAPTPEYRFHPVRRWRLDYAWPDAKLGLEVDGGIWVGGKHGRGAGIAKDQEKTNALARLGWRLLRVQPKQLATPATITLIQECLMEVA